MLCKPPLLAEAWWFRFADRIGARAKEGTILFWSALAEYLSIRQLSQACESDLGTNEQWLVVDGGTRPTTNALVDAHIQLSILFHQSLWHIT